VEIAENIGDFMTYYILAENGKVLARSSVRSTGKDLNLRLIGNGRNEGSMRSGWLDSNPLSSLGKYDKKEKGEPTLALNSDGVHSLNDIANIDAPVIQDPEDIIGFKFVGEFRGLPMSKTVTEYDPVNEECILELGNGLNEAVQYSTILEIFNKNEEDTDPEGIWSFEKITAIVGTVVSGK